MEFKTDLGKPWRFKEDDLTVTRSCVWSAPGCHPVGCGVKLYVDKDGRLVKVEGDENHPISHGTLCVRCLTMKDTIYHPDRILHPMKRDPKDRGKADKWERITWDEAFDLIESEWKRIRGKYGPESVVIWTGTGREGGTMQPYGPAVFGTPNVCYTLSGFACYAPRLACSAYVIGAAYPEVDYAGGLKGRYDDPAFKLPEVIVLWGKDPLPSNPDGFFGHSVVEMMKRGSKLITIDPRANWVSTRAEYNLRLRPGTDTALAMAMLNIIIREDLYDHDFVDKYTYGFDQLAERVADMTPEAAAEICGIDVEDIYGATRMYAKAKPASIAWGLAVDQKANGQQMAHSIVALMAITGNLDVPGGNILGGFADNLNELGFGYEALTEETRSKILGLQEYPAYVGMIINAHADMMLDALETGKPYPIKMGFFGGNNLLAGTCAAQPKRWHDAMIKSLEFNIGFDFWMTPSTQATCDLMLPLASGAESDGTVFTHYSALPVMSGMRSKALTVGEGKSDLELAYQLGKRLQPEIWARYPEFYDFIDTLRFRNQFKFEEMHKKVCVQREVSYRKYETGLLRADGEPGFNTPTGRVELWSTMFEHFGDDPLPYYEEPQYSPISTPELMKEYPFVLTTGARRYEYFHSEGKQIPYLREIHPDPTFDINPKDAAEKGIVSGEWCVLENQFGKCQLRANVSPIVKPGVIQADHGWWFPEEDGNEPHLYGVWRSNINNLVPHFHVGKMGWGAPFKCIICNVTKGQVED